MGMKEIQSKIMIWIQKYKYAVIILLIGVLLMMFPADIFSTQKQVQTSKVTQTDDSVQKELERILCCIYGAGDVKVMLQEAYGEETIYQVNEEVSVSDSSTNTRTNVITVTDENRNECGLIRQINPPQYLGAIILCQGGDDPSIRLAVTQAVSKITGLGADKIAVLKMK